MSKWRRLQGWVACRCFPHRNWIDGPTRGFAWLVLWWIERRMPIELPDRGEATAENRRVNELMDDIVLWRWVLYAHDLWDWGDSKRRRRRPPNYSYFPEVTP